jgi:hypothetical protein
MPEVLGRHRLGEQRVVALLAAGGGGAGLVKLEHGRGILLAEEIAHALRDLGRVADQVFVAHVVPSPGVELGAERHDEGVGRAPGVGGHVDVPGAERRFEAERGSVAAVAGDAYELGIWEIFQNLRHEIEVVGRLLAPARLVPELAGVAPVHGGVDTGEASLRRERANLGDRSCWIQIHPPQRMIEAKQHFARQRAEIGVHSEVAVGVAPRIDAREQPAHLGKGESGVISEHGHEQRRSRTLVANDENRPVAGNGHEVPSPWLGLRPGSRFYFCGCA